MTAPFDADRARALIGLLQPDRLTRVVDIGANPLDETPYAGLLSIGGCDVWGFEPQREAFERLVAARGPHEHYINGAVGDGSPATLHVCSDSGFTSLLEPDRAFADRIGQYGRRIDVVERVSLPTMRLDDIADLPPFDLLKIDVQGGECLVFRNGPDKLSRALAVITEVAALPIYRDQPLLHDQLAALAVHGFHLHKFLFFKTVGFRNALTRRLKRSRYRSQLSDGDAVLVRGLTDLAQLSDEELKHLAILADAVLLTQDLAVTAMAELARRGVLGLDGIHAYIDRLPASIPQPGDAALEGVAE
ncbi:FkbM family methyltransferase [Rhodobacterales bacterium HKCCSP123]|nr:FkbM family methyltransferase [Rhodobacterales bacterium HKCCSP123]